MNISTAGGTGLSRYPLSFENLQAFCERQALRYKANTERGQIAVLYRLLGRDAPLYIITRPERSMVTLALPFPLRVPDERIPHIGEAVTRLNSAAYMGTWVLNVETCEVYFRVTLPSLDAEYGDGSLLFAARLVVSTVEAAGKGLEQVLQGRSATEVWPAV